MAGTEPLFKVKLLVDKKKNKVVLAEAGKDFVDILFSFLTLPMGTIVRMLEKHQQDKKPQASAPIGCFNNVYKSVFDLGTASFIGEACREMLLYPRSETEGQRRKLKLNIDDTEVLKYFRCSKNTYVCNDAYSNFRSSRCSCGALMATEFETHEDAVYGEIFVSNKTSFTITNNMRVEFTSTGFTLKLLKELGYTDVDQLNEIFADVNHEKVLALMFCLFSSETPLTDVFLMKRSSYDLIKAYNMPSLPFEKDTRGETGSNEVMSVSVLTRKVDNKVLYVESGKDFVDLLFTFLILPLNSAWEMSGEYVILGCLGNLCTSFKRLSFASSSSSKGTKATSSNTCMLPWYYSCKSPLLDVGFSERNSSRKFLINRKYCNPMDPRSNVDGQSLCSGFVKEGATFMVTDDLIITPINFSLTISTLKKWNMDLDDIEEQVISISKAEAIRLLRAAFMTSSALDTALGSFLPKKPKEEKL